MYCSVSIPLVGGVHKGLEVQLRNCFSCTDRRGLTPGSHEGCPYIPIVPLAGCGTWDKIPAHAGTRYAGWHPHDWQLEGSFSCQWPKAPIKPISTRTNSGIQGALRSPPHCPPGTGLPRNDEDGGAFMPMTGHVPRSLPRTPIRGRSASPGVWGRPSRHK